MTNPAPREFEYRGKKYPFEVFPWNDDVTNDHGWVGAGEATAAYDQLAKRCAKLEEQLSDTNSWLKRMSNLKWDDPEYAPKFKACYERNCEALKTPSDGGAK